ncbi:MAG: glycosyltransferase [Spirochaetota bacterium]
MKVSVIVPTYNEEEYLPKILDCLKSQTMDPDEYEIIVADADSDDRTPEIAREYGAKVVPGGMPAEGRNAGAEVAVGDYFFFFDADVKFSRDFLENAYNEMQERFVDVATCEVRPLSNVPLDRMMHDFANLYVRLNQYTNPMAPGYCILITSRLYHRVGGFNTDITLAEDFDLIRRAAKLRPFRVLDSVHITVSVRRYRKEGRLAFIGHSLAVSWHRTFKGEIKGDIDYEFGDFSVSKDDKGLRKLERRINKLARRLQRMSRKNRSGGAEPDEKQTRSYEQLQTRLKELYERFQSGTSNVRSGSDGRSDDSGAES